MSAESNCNENILALWTEFINTQWTAGQSVGCIMFHRENQHFFSLHYLGHKGQTIYCTQNYHKEIDLSQIGPLDRTNPKIIEIVLNVNPCYFKVQYIGRLSNFDTYNYTTAQSFHFDDWTKLFYKKYYRKNVDMVTEVIVQYLHKQFHSSSDFTFIRSFDELPVYFVEGRYKKCSEYMVCVDLADPKSLEQETAIAIEEMKQILQQSNEMESTSALFSSDYSKPTGLFYAHILRLPHSYRGPEIEQIVNYSSGKRQQLKDYANKKHIDFESPSRFTITLEFGHSVAKVPRLSDPEKLAQNVVSMHLDALLKLAENCDTGEESKRKLMQIDDDKEVPFLDMDPENMWIWRIPDEDEFECNWCKGRKSDTPTCLWGAHVRIWIGPFSHHREDICQNCLPVLRSVWQRESKQWIHRSNPLEGDYLTQKCKQRKLL